MNTKRARLLLPGSCPLLDTAAQPRYTEYQLPVQAGRKSIGRSGCKYPSAVVRGLFLYWQVSQMEALMENSSGLIFSHKFRLHQRGCSLLNYELLTGNQAMIFGIFRGRWVRSSQKLCASVQYFYRTSARKAREALVSAGADIWGFLGFRLLVYKTILHFVVCFLCPR